MPHSARRSSLLVVSDEERESLEAWARSPEATRGIALRARIILGCADGKTIAAVSEELGVSKTTAGKWRSRFLEGGLGGLQDKPRPRRVRKRDEPLLHEVHHSAKALGFCKPIGKRKGNWPAMALAAAHCKPRTHEAALADAVRLVARCTAHCPKGAGSLALFPHAQLHPINPDGSYRYRESSVWRNPFTSFVPPDPSSQLRSQLGFGTDLGFICRVHKVHYQKCNYNCEYGVTVQDRFLLDILRHGYPSAKSKYDHDDYCVCLRCHLSRRGSHGDLNAGRDEHGYLVGQICYQCTAVSLLHFVFLVFQPVLWTAVQALLLVLWIAEVMLFALKPLFERLRRREGK